MSTTVLPSTPRLAPLYVKAVLGAALPGRGPRELPDTVLVREDVTVDRDHLAEYDRICGFPLTDTLPPTYLHVLGFPLQLALMTSRGFPLPLPGLVHIRNVIIARRSVGIGERLAIRVHAERYGPHPRGAQVDLVTEVSSADGRVWEGHSTYLSRGARAPDRPQPDSPPEPELVETPVPAAVWQVATGVGRRYAAVSGDVNPIHLHPLAARAFGFPRTIAHGMWTAARALATVYGRLGGIGELTYDVAFGKPLLLPSTVELRTQPVNGGWNLDVRSASTGSVHLRAALRSG